MLKWFSRAFKKDKLPDALEYEEARDVLQTENSRLRKQLAKRPDVRPEMLYFLASDQDIAVRSLVAANHTTPIQADLILANDESEYVRIELAHKIARLVPDLKAEDAERTQSLVEEVLQSLADDQIVRVRQILSEELKDSSELPKDIALKLARDLENVVSTPILEYSPLLSDADLIELIAGGLTSDALRAVSRRSGLSENVSAEIVATLDIPAIADLLVNPNAQIREDTLDQILDHAAGIEAWHQPLVARPGLSLRAMRRVASFVASSLLMELCERNNIPEHVLLDVKERVQSRIRVEEGLSSENNHPGGTAKARAKKAARTGSLTDEFVAEAIEANDYDLVVECLARLSKTPQSVVQRILTSKHGKAITALVWKAELPMRISLKVQSLLVQVPPHSMMMARDGIDFPMTDEEMEWQLKYFTKSS